MPKPIFLTIRNRIATAECEDKIVSGNSDYPVIIDFDSDWDQHDTKTIYVKYGCNQLISRIFTGTETVLPKIPVGGVAEIGVEAGNIKTTTGAVLMVINSITSNGTATDLTEDQYAQIMERIDNLEAEAIPDSKIQEAINDYLTENPVAPGATPEQAEQIERNKTDIQAINDAGFATEKYVDDAIEKIEISGGNGAPGQDGADGVGIQSIEKTGSDGLVDTYTIVMTDGNEYRFTVTNGRNGENGADGADGYTPVKGTDYWTDADKQEIGDYVLAQVPEDAVTSVNGKTGDVQLTAADVGAVDSGQLNYIVNSVIPTQLSSHNSSTSAHQDIRSLVSDLTARLNALANSDDTTLDQMAEIVAYIQNNRDLIEQVTTTKVSVDAIVDNLETNISTKPLSAAQGVALKALIDALDSEKLDASALSSAIDSALAQAKESGEFDGAEGYTPVKGVDYFTQDDISETATQVAALITPDSIGAQAKRARVDISSGTTVALADNCDYYGSAISNLTFTYPEGDFDCYITIITDEQTTPVLNFPASTKYIGASPTLGLSERWEISVKNGVVVAAKAE